ncbi:hypothetical protein AX14_003640 [Amanita brunnescens Koide BX004]|nr:hypothetical protein AX14_003640 [Amanita brunnescens Koide BX004]
MSHKIKSCRFDNTTRNVPTVAASTVSAAAQLPLTVNAPPSSDLPSSTLSGNARPLTPLEVFSTVSYAHRVSCSHPFASCSVCSLGIVCCSCNKLHTAPARLKLCCAACSHFACATCTTPYCCACRKPWYPSDSPAIVLASQLRGGARSTKSSKKGSSSSSQSSGPGSLATAHSARNSPDPFMAPTAPQVTQSSTDEIDAFADNTVRLALPLRHDTTARAAAPSLSSNLPPTSLATEPVFSRPEMPTVVDKTEDVPTAVPSRAPSRAASVASAPSVGNAGIAELLVPDSFEQPSEPPALNDIIGRIHRRHPLASLKVDDEDSHHFLARDDTRVDDIANETEYLLSSTTSWPTILYFICDIMKFESIKGSMAEFQVVLAGLAEIWSNASDFDTREVLRNMIEAVRLMPKAEKEIDRLESTAQRYRNERQAARTQLKTTEAELSRLRQAANDTLDSNARLLAEIDQLRATDAIVMAREQDEARLALQNAIAHSKSSMAKQVSRYQHLFSLAEERQSRLHALEKEAEDKDAYILKTEAEHAEIYRERENAERLVASLRQQLHDATTLFEAAREERRHDQKDYDEKVVGFKAHISELNSRLNLLPPGEAELRSLVGMANERAGIAEEEYRKKSAELKNAKNEISVLNSKLAALESKPPPAVKTSNSKKEQASMHPTNKTVRWGFEPNADAPASQPFWDHTNEYSRYIASMVAATVTAIPSIPMQTAISTAIETVRAAGPSILSQNPKTTNVPKTSTSKSSPNLAKKPTTPPPQPCPPSPAAAASSKSSKTMPTSLPVQPASMTFAQMAASVLDTPTAAPMHPAKAKPSWRAIETNKSLVLRPGTKGTRVSELHIRVPKVPATTYLFSLSGTKLINEILRLVNETHNKAGIRALKENHLVLVKWSMRGNLIFKCSKPMDDVIKECLHDAIKSAVPPSSTDSIAILNKPPTTALKFSSVPRHNEDGTDTDSYDLHNDLMANELWRDVEIFSQPRFLPMKPDAAGGTVIVSVVDDNVGSVGRKLMNSVVVFSGASRRCLRWVEKEAQLHCTQCQTWGHLNFNCLSNIMRCSKCAGPHDYCQHDRYCDTCKAGKGHLCIPKCFNCRGAHFANSKDCIFYLNRSSKERQIQLRDEFSQKWKDEEAAIKAAANTDSGRAARSAIATGIMKPGPKDKGKAKAPAKRPQKDDDDYTPVGRGGKAKYTFGGMAQALAPTTRVDDVPTDKDNDSDASSDLRLSYLDDVPLKQRFPELKPPVPPLASTTDKPLTITLPANTRALSKPTRSVTDILRELEKPTEALPTRFGGGEVAYSASALESEAVAFASALDAANLPSQPSPTQRDRMNSLPINTVPDSDLASATMSQVPTNPHD